MMVSGLSRRVLRDAAGRLRPAGIIPLQAGGVGSVEARMAMDAKLAPGATIAIPIVTGDVDLSAISTTTDVVAGRVLALGHAFFSEGDVDFPMGPGYIHMVVPSISRSFKLGAPLKIGQVLQHTRLEKRLHGLPAGAVRKSDFCHDTTSVSMLVVVSVGMTVG